MRNGRRTTRKALLALALSVVTAAALAGPAAGEPRGDVDRQRAEIPYLSHGITTQSLVATPWEGVSSPDGYQPQLGGDQPVVVRDTPDGYQPQTRTAEVSAVASRGGFDLDEAVVGLGFGLALAAMCALALMAIRSRTRLAGV